MTKTDKQMVDVLVKQCGVPRNVAIDSVKAWRKAEREVKRRFKPIGDFRKL